MDFSLPASSATTPNSFIMTPQQAAQQQLLAQELMKSGSDYSPVRSPWQGAARLAEALSGAVQYVQANRAQNLGTADGASASALMLNKYMGTDPGDLSIPATPGQSTANLDQSDALQDKLQDAADGDGPPVNSALARGLGAQPINPQAQATAALIRQAALARGIDPNVALTVAQSEGLNSYTGDNGSSFGPFQLHYGGVAPGGNRVPGMGDDFTKATGLDARDPATVPQQINYALDRAKAEGWGAWHGAANAGLSKFAGIGMPGLGAAPPVQVSALPPIPGAPPSRAQGSGVPAPAGPQGAGAASPPPAPSQADLSALSGAMQAAQPQGGVMAAQAAPAPPNPALARAASPPASLPVAGGGGPAPSAPSGQVAPAPSGIAPASTAAAPGTPPLAPPPAAPAPLQQPAQPMGNAPAGIHPDIAALMNVISNPWATPQQQQVAMTLLQAQMPTPPTWVVIGKDVAGNEQYGWINPKTMTVTPAGGSGLPGGGGALPPVAAASSPAPAGVAGGAPAPQPVAGAPGAPGQPVAGSTANGLTPQGAAYLDQMEAAGGASAVVARNARAIINGQAPLPEANAATKPIDVAIRDAVLRAAPGFNSTVAAAKAKAMTDFADGSSPQSPGGMIRNLNTAMGHLGRLSDSSEALGGADTGYGIGQALNAVGNTFPSLEGAQRLHAYNEDLQHFVEEATKFYQGSAGTQFDREKALENLSPNAPPSVRRAAIAELGQLLQTKEQELQRNWHQAAPGSPDYPILGPEAKEAFSKVQSRNPASQGPVTLNPANPDADYAALPSGTKFIGPDGHVRTKP